MPLLADPKKGYHSISEVNVDISSGTSLLSEDLSDYVDPLAYESTLSKELSSRHIGMIILVGVFGTGLFLSSGSTLANTGPVGMLLGYIFVGMIVGTNQMCITETSCLMPATSGYVRHAEHFVDDSLAFTLGWINVYCAIIPTELSATAVLMEYWTDLTPAVWITLYSLVVVAINSYNIRFYGEIEFFFGILKFSLIVILVITGTTIDLGGVPGKEKLGFQYWRDPGPFAEMYFEGNWGKFAGFWRAVSSIVYSFGGIQAISLLAGETRNPRRALYRAGQRVFYRVFGLYLITIFVLSLIVPYDNKQIAAPNGTASASPFVIAMQGSIKALPHVVNAIVCTSALSSQNVAIVAVSRILFAMAAKGQAPKVYLKTNKRGLPWVGVTTACLFMPLAYMSVNEASNNVFSWLQNVASSTFLINWIVIAVTHIRMTKAMKVQGYSRSQLPYTFPGTQYGSYFSLVFSGIILITSGFPNFIKGNFDFGSFFGTYFAIPLFVVLFGGHKLATKNFKTAEEVDLKNLFRHVELHPEPPYPKLKGWEWLTVLWA